MFLVLLALLGLILAPTGRTLAQTGGPTPTPVPPSVPTPTPLPPGAPQLAITKSVQPPSGPVGTRVTFTIVVSNIGAGDAHDVVVNDVIPGQVQVLSASTTRGTVNITGQRVQVTIGTLAPGEIVTITIVGVIRVGTRPGETIRNLVRVQASDADPASASADLLPVETVLPKSGDAPGNWLLPGLLLILALAVGGVVLHLHRPARR